MSIWSLQQLNNLGRSIWIEFDSSMEKELLCYK